MSDNTPETFVLSAMTNAQAVGEFYESIQKFIVAIIDGTIFYAGVYQGATCIQQAKFSVGAYHAEIYEASTGLGEPFRDSDGKATKVYEIEISKKVPRKTLLGKDTYTWGTILRDHYHNDAKGKTQLFRCGALTNNYLDPEDLAYLRDYLDTLKGITEAAKQYVNL